MSTQPVLVPCPACAGDGWIMDEDPRHPGEPIQEQCVHCAGAGTVVFDDSVVVSFENLDDVPF